MKRDPRVEPKEGDQLRLSGVAKPFEVSEVTAEGSVLGRFRGGRLTRWGLTYWREVRAKDAEVLNVAE